MKNFIVLLTVLLFLFTVYSCSANQPVAPSDNTQQINSAQESSSPAPEAPLPAVPPELDTLLDKIEKTGAALKSFQADMLYQQEQLLIDTITIRNGKIYYQADEKTVRFRIHFADWVQKDMEDETSPPTVRFDEEFVFDGLWVTRRNERTKTIQRWEIAKKPRPREDFRLGKGPFPLPFAIRKADVLVEFEIKLIPPDPNQKTDNEHLVLKPKKESSYADEYLSLALWVNRKTAIPQKISYLSADNQVTTVTWSNIKTDQVIKDNLFELEPAGPGWTTEETPLEETPSEQTQKNDT